LRYRRFALTLLIGIAILSTGCSSGAKETDEVAYVIGIGIDATDSDKVDVTYRIAIPRALSTGGGGAGSDKTSELVTIRAANLAEARNFLNSIVARSPNLSHTKALVIGEKLARKGVNKLLGPVFRFHEFRGTILLGVISDDTTAKEFMAKNKPVLEILPSKYYETQALNAAESGYFIRSTLHDFYGNMKSNSRSAYAVFFGLNPLNGLDRPSKQSTLPSEVDQYVAGYIPRIGGNPAEALGTAIFCKDKMVGILTNEETRMLSILEGNFPGDFMVVQDPTHPQDSVNIRLRLMKNPQITVGLADKQAMITIKVFLEGEITAIPSGVNYESQYQQMLEDQITLAIKQNMEQMLKKTQELGSDVAGFGYYARANFSNFDDFMAMDWDEVYSQSTIKVDVVTEIRRAGLMQQTAPIR
jgi:spore germination protein KC